MKKFTLSIPKPCHENWDNMTPEAQGKFCAACKKSVMDFTNMNDREIAEFFNKKSDSVCGRFQQDQLYRVIEMPRKRIPWVKQLLTITLPAMFLVSKATAQSVPKPIPLGMVSVKSFSCQEPVKKDSIETSVTKTEEPITITGKVINEKGEPIPFASVQIKNTTTSTQTDKEGVFQLKQLKPEQKEIIISALGYDAKTVTTSANELTITLSEANTKLMGEVVAGYVMKKKAMPVPLIPIQKTDVAFSKFSVYPNPVIANSTFTLDAKNLEEGIYQLMLVKSEGIQVQTKELLIDMKAKQFTLEVGNLAAGSYFIQLTNKNSLKSFTERIVIK